MSDETTKATQVKVYESTPQDKRRARVLGVIYIVLAVFLAWMLFKIWPPTPWPTDKALETNPQLAKYLRERECPTPTPTPAGATSANSPSNTQPGGSNVTSTPGPTPTSSPSPTGTAGDAGTTGGANNQPRTDRTTATPTPTPTPIPPETLVDLPISFFWGYWCYRTSFDERLILLVIVAGMLGSFVHGATSLADYIGNNKFDKRWTWFYLMRPAIGMALALVFYFVIRGGFLTTSGGAKDINPYGIAALAGLVGMFSKQATDKLSEVFGTLFRSAAGQGDAKRSGSLKPDAEAGAVSALAITLIEPDLGSPTGAELVSIAGTGFLPQASVTFGDAPATIVEMNATEIVVTTPPHAPGPVDVTVTNSDGKQAVKTGGYTFGPPAEG